jgi:hypothetical protein
VSASRDYGIGLAMFLASVILARRQRQDTQSPYVGSGAEICVEATDGAHAGETACGAAPATPLDGFFDVLNGLGDAIAGWSWFRSSGNPTSSTTPIGGITSIGDKPPEEHPGFGFYEDPDR